MKKKNRIGLGTFPFDEEVWGKISEKKAIEILVEANRRGVNYFNSAYYYGKGRCEEILGKAIQKMDRKKVVVATKIGTEFGEFSLSEKRITRSIKSILKRMQLDYIDVFLFHKPDVKTSLVESVSAMLKIKEKGLIKSIGISNFSIELAEKMLELTPIEVIEFYFSMLTQKEGRVTLEFCEKNKIVATPYKVIERGILTDSFLKDNKDILKINWLYNNFHTQKKNLRDTELLIKRLQKIAQRKNITLAQLAISWVFHQFEMTVPLLGIRTLEYLEEDLQSVNVKLAQEDLEEIDKILEKDNKLNL